MTRLRSPRTPPSLSRLVVVALGAIATSYATPAWADDTLGQCIAASDSGIDLRKHGKLLDARKVLATCAVAACGPDVKASCEKRLAEIAAALPTIVFMPKNGAGDDLAGVKVMLDSAPLSDSIDGRPFTVDPGRHTFRFESHGQVVEKDFVLNEKDKDRRETILFTPPVPAAPPTPVVAPASPAPAEPPSLQPSPEEKEHARSGVKTAGFVLAGAGVVGIAVGSVFGVLAISDNNAAKCNANSYCVNPGSRTAAQGVATGSTAGFVAGGVLLATGVVMVLAAPKSSTGTAGRWELAPMVGAETGGLLVRGRW